MHAAKAAFILLALTAPALAGCINAPDDAVDAQAASNGTPTNASWLVDAAGTLAEIKSYSEAFPMRRGDNDAHNAARAYLLATYEGLGYEAHMDEFTAPISPISTPTSVVAGNDRLVNIIGIKWGTTQPEEWLVVGAHYDVTDGAIYGAYDDGSGTIIVQNLATAFKDLSFPRTIIFANFDGEEQGLRGSSHMMEAITNGEWLHNNGTVVGMVDFDMAGITYPSGVPMVADAVSPEMQDVIRTKMVDLEWPEDMLEFRGISGGSSDNGPFKAAEIPSVLFISDFDDVRYQNQEVPGNYPFWHQFDTYEAMVRMAGSEAALLEGFQATIDLGGHLVHEMAMGLDLTFKAHGE